jgi:hypothetical protein
MVNSQNTTYSKRLQKLISWSHWFTFFNIFAVIIASSYYLWHETLPESAIGIAYLISTWFSHMAFLTFVGFMILVFPLTVVFPYTRFIRGYASVIFSISIILLLLDAFIYNRLGYHLNASSKQQIVQLISAEIRGNSRNFWLITTSLFMLVLAFEMVVSNYAWKHLKQLQQTHYAKKIVATLVGLFVFSHITHIWADAKLDYNVLKQDTILPLSYPTTAKALLTKYGLFDRNDYIARRNAPLALTDNKRPYPDISNQCAINNTLPEQAVILVLTDKFLSKQALSQATHRSRFAQLRLNHHIDNAKPSDAWFNFFYSLPSIYQQDFAVPKQTPAIFQLLNHYQLPANYHYISTNNQSDTLPLAYHQLFQSISSHHNIGEFAFNNVLTNLPKGLHIFHFADDGSFQFELFMDALQLAQINKPKADIIWLSSIGNRDNQTQFLNKKAAFIWPDKKKSKNIDVITSQMDVMPTLISQWLGCKIAPSFYSTGADLFALSSDRVIANTEDNGIMVFNKDKSVFIDQNGNFQSYSRLLNAPIIDNADFPLLIDGVNFITSFNKQNSLTNE